MSLSLLLTDKTLPSKKLLCACALSVSIVLSGCSNSGTPTSSLTGSVSAPGGSIAFNQPSGIKRMFAEMIGGKLAHAAITGVSTVGAGVTIELIEVDASGNQVGDAIASATTDASGAYSLTVHSGFSPDSKYVIRATGINESMDVRVTGTSNDIDPVTDAVSDLVTTIAADLSTISVTEITEIRDALDGIAQNVDPAGLTAEALSAALKTEANNDEVFSNQLNSTVAAGSICGTVTNSSGSPLANIRVVAQDFSNVVTRAKTKTAADGSYCLNVPVAGDTDAYNGKTLNGQYILGAFNRTDDTNDSSRHASEWWSAGGTAYNRFDAEVITVAGTTAVTGKDFQLEPGARIKGTVTAGDTSAALESVKVFIRDFDNRTVVSSARVKADGSYRVNVIAGKYLVVARNRTLKAYASEIYDGGTGTSNRNLGAPVTVATGDSTTLDFALEAGYKLSGTITDGGTAVTGMRVMVNNSSPGGPADRLRTNKQGKYRIWLKPATYKVYAYGQRNTAVNLSASNQTVNFSAAVSAISATLKDSGGNPVTQAKFRLYDTSNTFLGFEISSSDGSVTMHTDQTGNHRVQVRVDRAGSAGSVIHSGQTQLGSATAINITGTDVSLGDITLPDGGVLKGTVYAGNSGDTSTAKANFSIEVRDGDTTSASRFVRVTTRGDGSYVLTLPAGTYERVKMRDATSGGNCDTVVITAGATTTLNYFDGNDTCQ